MIDVIAARALHVASVVVWIGGLSMITTVLLPAMRRGELGQNRLQAFQAIECRFAWQARSTVALVGLTGFYMTWRFDLWGRFSQATFWWMHAMVCLWLLFTFLLFVAEPIFLRRHFLRLAMNSPDITFAWFHRAHRLLLALSIVTILGAVAGSHGWQAF